MNIVCVVVQNRSARKENANDPMQYSAAPPVTTTSTEPGSTHPTVGSHCLRQPIDDKAKAKANVK